jgi:hypoxanthine phosphoribosyltransferase
LSAYGIIAPDVALITVSGDCGSRHDEVARLAAARLRFEHFPLPRLLTSLEREFALAPGAFREEGELWANAATAYLARLAAEQHLVVSAGAAEQLMTALAGVLRVRIHASESARAGAVMLDEGCDRAEAMRRVAESGRGPRARSNKAFDLVLNAERLTTEQMAEITAAAAEARLLPQSGFLPLVESQRLEMEARLNLAGHGIAPQGPIPLERRGFSHPSEEVFANLLDFYRIAWEYEPRSFPIEWDEAGQVVEAFTPDFYLPEFGTFVELTTMKQHLVTRKNRKIRRLRELHPEVRIQVFYQRDFDNLVFKLGLNS